MKKIKIIISVLAIIVVLGAGLFVYNALQQEGIEKQQDLVAGDTQKEVFLRIDFGDGTSKNYSIDFKENYSAFDLLKEASEKLIFPVKSKTYDIGVFIEAINNIEGGKDNKYWAYYINGELPMVAADKNYLKTGDRVEFKFEESKF